MELYDNEGPFLIASGGVPAPHGLPVQLYGGGIFLTDVYTTDDDSIGVAVPTVLIPNKPQLGACPDNYPNAQLSPGATQDGCVPVDRRDMIRIDGVGHRTNNNICVGPGFACGESPTIPDTVWTQDCVNTGRCVQDGPFRRFVDLRDTSPWPTFVFMETYNDAYLRTPIGFYYAASERDFGGCSPGYDVYCFNAFIDSVRRNNPTFCVAPNAPFQAACQDGVDTGDFNIQFNTATGGYIRALITTSETDPDGNPINQINSASCPSAAGSPPATQFQTLFAGGFTGRKDIEHWNVNYRVTWADPAIKVPVPNADPQKWAFGEGPLRGDHNGNIIIKDPNQSTTCHLSLNGPAPDCDDRDLDGDLIPDDQDNCPTVRNSDQTADANWDAELELARAAQCADYSTGGCPGDEGHVPAATDSVQYIQHFHAYYRGDACDTNATTAISAETVDSPLGLGHECNVCIIVGSYLAGCALEPGNCPIQLTSGIVLTSYIGNSAGDAGTADGTSGPSFCRCDEAIISGYNPDPRWHDDCQRQRGARQCNIGLDRLFPTDSALEGSGWLPISETIAFGHQRFDQYIAPQPTKHQEDGDLTKGYVAAAGQARRTWNYPLDLPAFGIPATDTPSPLTGILWGSVRTFAPVGQESQPVANSPESYLPVTVTQKPKTVFRVVGNPQILNRVLPGDVIEWGGNNGVTGDPWIVAVQGGPIEETATAGAQVISNRVDEASTALFNAVAVGTADALVGDDVVGGVTTRSRTLPLVFVSPGTTQIQGALQVTHGVSVAGVLAASSTGAVDPPDLRSYDARDGLLRSLHVDTAGAAINSIDVGQALGGVATPTRTALTGELPVSPRAMVWSVQDSALYVIDALPVKHKNSVLRLLKLDSNGVSTELWRLDAGLPETVYLTTSRMNERVLTVARRGGIEVATFDRDGVPSRSFALRGNVAAAPILTDAGFSVPLVQQSGGKLQNGLLDVRTVRRADAAPGLCGARWLRHHFDGPGRAECDNDKGGHDGGDNE